MRYKFKVIKVRGKYYVDMKTMLKMAKDFSKFLEIEIREIGTLKLKNVKRGAR